MFNIFFVRMLTAQNATRGGILVKLIYIIREITVSFVLVMLPSRENSQVITVSWCTYDHETDENSYGEYSEVDTTLLESLTQTVQRSLRRINKNISNIKR